MIESVPDSDNKTKTGILNKEFSKLFFQGLKAYHEASRWIYDRMISSPIDGKFARPDFIKKIISNKKEKEKKRKRMKKRKTARKKQ